MVKVATATLRKANAIANRNAALKELVEWWSNGGSSDGGREVARMAKTAGLTETQKRAFTEFSEAELAADSAWVKADKAIERIAAKLARSEPRAPRKRPRRSRR